MTGNGRPAMQPGVPSRDWPDLNLLTADEVCALLQVKKSWLYDTVEHGAIRAIRLGRQLRFRQSDIAAYIERAAG